MAAPRKPILTLDAIAPERPTIKIKTKKNPRGKLYELASPKDFSLLDQQLLFEEGERIQNMGRDLSDDEVLELELSVDKVGRIVLPGAVADGAWDHLSVWEKVKVLQAFGAAFPDPGTRGRQKTATRKKRSTRAS